MIEAFDLSILQACYAGSLTEPWVDAIVVITFLGSGWMLLGLVPAFFVRRVRLPAALLLLTLAVTSAAVASVKALSARPRPCHALGWAHTLRIAVPTDASFPSGHAAGSFAFAFFVLAVHRRAGMALVLLAVAVACSRVALGVHYPSDVTVGALLGALLGSLGARCAARIVSVAVERDVLADADGAQPPSTV
jgi:undecaprenyl-diphosphatase